MYSAMLIYTVQQCDSVIHINAFFFHILCHYGLSQNIEYSSLCSTIGPCCSLTFYYTKFNAVLK